MSDELLPYYNEELSHIRGMAAEFARQHPKIAARLRISGDTVEDPHVERLIEAFAYLNARIRHKLDDDFPELSDALLGALYPHYLAPIPSMAIVQMVPKPDLVVGYEVQRGTLVGVPFETDELIRPVGLIHKRRKNLTRTAQRFIRALVEGPTPSLIEI